MEGGFRAKVEKILPTPVTWTDPVCHDWLDVSTIAYAISVYRQCHIYCVLTVPYLFLVVMYASFHTINLPSLSHASMDLRALKFRVTSAPEDLYGHSIRPTGPTPEFQMTSPLSG